MFLVVIQINQFLFLKFDPSMSKFVYLDWKNNQKQIFLLVLNTTPFSMDLFLLWIVLVDDLMKINEVVVVFVVVVGWVMMMMIPSCVLPHALFVMMMMTMTMTTSK